MKKLKFRKTLRSLHRDLGYFFVGLSLIYGISGIILNYKVQEKDPAYKEYIVHQTIKQDLSPQELKALWQQEFGDDAPLNRIIPQEDRYRLFLKGGVGYYDPTDGEIYFTVYKEKRFVKFINVIHYNTGKKFTWLGNVFAGSLIFFAITGSIMLKGKRGFLKRGVWIMVVGVLVPIIWYLIVM